MMVIPPSRSEAWSWELHLLPSMHLSARSTRYVYLDAPLEIRALTVVTQQFKPTSATIGGSFICLIIWFAGRAWAAALPRGDKMDERWRKQVGEDEADSTPLPLRIKVFKLLNPSLFGLKEHAVAAITASSASNGAASIQVFTTQNLYYPDNPLTPMIVILATLSIGLFGYGLTGLFRPITVDNAEAVYWSQIPLLSLLQNLHWSDLKTSKRLRWFWYAFGFMAIYQIMPGYMFPWLNSVSIPCLASMHATGSKAAILTNLFGGALNNEGLGILNFSFDWQYVRWNHFLGCPPCYQLNPTLQITSFSTSLPLVRQVSAQTPILSGDGQSLTRAGQRGCRYSDVLRCNDWRVLR